MNIQEIANRILVEGGVREDVYTAEDRIFDINKNYRYYVELAVQKEPFPRLDRGITSPFSPNVDTDQLSDVQTYDSTSDTGTVTTSRDIPHIDVLAVDFQYENSEGWQKVHIKDVHSIEDHLRHEVEITETDFTIRNRRKGTYRFQYARNGFVEFLVTDLDIVVEADIPFPLMLPEVFHPLLYLDLALGQAQLYKPSNVPKLERELDRLERLFNNHYDRTYNQNAGMLVSGERDNSCKFGADEVDHHQL